MHTIRNIRRSYSSPVRNKEGKRVFHYVTDTFPLSPGCVSDSGKPVPVLSLLTRYGGLTNGQEKFREIAQHLSALPSSGGYKEHSEALKYLKPKYLQSPKEISDFCDWFSREYDVPLEEVETRLSSSESKEKKEDESSPASAAE